MQNIGAVHDEGAGHAGYVDPLSSGVADLQPTGVVLHQYRHETVVGVRRGTKNIGRYLGRLRRVMQ